MGSGFGSCLSLAFSQCKNHLTKAAVSEGLGSRI